MSEQMMSAGGAAMSQAFQQHVAAHEAAFYAPQTRSKILLRVEEAADTGHIIVERQLVVPGDNGEDAVMGRVHMVQLGANPHENHFLYDIDGDVNEGQKAIVDRGRRGPFAASRGSSAVMDRSAHVTYRHRSGRMEITINRGCSQSELTLLFAKLNEHRMSVSHTTVVFTKGRRTYRLGPLDDQDFDQLRQKILECLHHYKQCGISLVEVKPGKGAMYRPSTHGTRFKNRKFRPY